MDKKKYDLVIEELVETYQNTQTNEDVFYKKIKQLLPKINEFDFCDFIGYMLDKSLDSIWTDMLICLHSKFVEIPCTEIIFLLESFTSRFQRIVLLVYLCKYLEVDGLMVLSKSKIESKDKDSLEHFIKSNREFLTKNQNDIQLIKKYNKVSQNELKRSGEQITNCINKLANKEN